MWLATLTAKAELGLSTEYHPKLVLCSTLIGAGPLWVVDQQLAIEQSVVSRLVGIDLRNIDAPVGVFMVSPSGNQPAKRCVTSAEKWNTQ